MGFQMANQVHSNSPLSVNYEVQFKERLTVSLDLPVLARRPLGKVFRELWVGAFLDLVLVGLTDVVEHRRT